MFVRYTRDFSIGGVREKANTHSCAGGGGVCPDARVIAARRSAALLGGAPLVPEPHAETKYTSVPVEFSAMPDAAQPVTGGRPLVEPEFVCPSSAVHMSSFMSMFGSSSVQATTPFDMVICW